MTARGAVCRQKAQGRSAVRIKEGENDGERHENGLAPND